MSILECLLIPPLNLCHCLFIYSNMHLPQFDWIVYLNHFFSEVEITVDIDENVEIPIVFFHNVLPLLTETKMR